MQDLINRVFSIQTEEEFNQCALEVFHFQKEHVPVYKTFLELINRPEPKHFSEIPHLPIAFFKSHQIIAENKMAQQVFKSSGTTGMTRSAHFVADVSIYERSFIPTYEQFLGKLEDQIIFALLPNYVSQGESSLVYMVDKLIEGTNNSLSGYYLESPESLLEAISQGQKTGKKLVLFGVSYALLDLAEMKPDLHDVTVIETGGMKGKRKEMTKEEMHQELVAGFRCDYIASEYGMCELLSQAYSDKNGMFELPAWMKISLREVNDPFELVKEDKTGGVNVIDLANIYSCAFIETQDLGRMEKGKLRLMGRFDHSDVRGCNLLVAE
ncbi:acyltransferase [Fluviicola taffensis]|uniref:Acyl-protein synthetase, LuxE n=1 Tax=Fluviicola taffensis (strain DSM 16823 / NCIMB 13979 / RW262) TaxID=755732 RepID=F2IIW6_FLUTR|nr:acyltransferase [Fluviicola taffensis]AEA42823.1 acyl-protein synthetase, LuxE [Fluviicola taffensis DSM 16823]